MGTKFEDFRDAHGMSQAILIVANTAIFPCALLGWIRDDEREGIELGVAILAAINIAAGIAFGIQLSRLKRTDNGESLGLVALVQSSLCVASGVLGIILGVRAFQGQNQPSRSELTKASSILTMASCLFNALDASAARRLDRFLRTQGADPEASATAEDEDSSPGKGIGDPQRDTALDTEVEDSSNQDKVSPASQAEGTKEQIDEETPPPKVNMQSTTAVKTGINTKTVRSQEDEISQARTLIV